MNLWVDPKHEAPNTEAWSMYYWAQDVDAAIRAMQRQEFEVVSVDTSMGGDILSWIFEQQKELPIYEGPSVVIHKHQA